MDGLAIGALCRDWNQLLRHGRIDRIHQPGAREVVLTVRTQGRTQRLLLSAHRQYARAHTLYSARPDNPEDPPAFCLSLRKRIESGRIVSVSQQGRDRVLEFLIEAQSEVGDPVLYLLILEAMGRHSNLLLCTVDGEGKADQVVDCIVRVTPHMSRVRPVLPGLAYQLPPAQQQLPPADFDEQRAAELGLSSMPWREQTRALMRTIAGVGPVTAKELLHRAGPGLEPAAVAAAVQQLAVVVEEGLEPPSLGLDELGRRVAAAPFCLTAWPRSVQTSSFDEALDLVYAELAEDLLKSGRSLHLRVRLDQVLERLQAKQRKLLQMLGENRDHEQLRICGDLLVAYAQDIERGARCALLPNFYDDERPLAITLDPARTAIENAQRYYRQSSKRKRSIPILETELAQTDHDLLYLESVRQQLEDAPAAVLVEIEEELIKEGFVPPRKGRGQKRDKHKSKPSQPLTCTSQDGFAIHIGRNNAQNDRLTFRNSQPDDIWLHVKDTPGSHVVVAANGQSVPESTVEQAAVLAAYFSKARNSGHVAVDWTAVKHVWKPSGARPGFALYDHQHTLYVTPERSQVAQLLERTK